MKFFQKYLSVWVILCMIIGVSIGHFFPMIPNILNNEKRFVILTTKANASMEKTHDRMPLILEKEQLADWFDDKKMEQLLQHTPVMLKREAEYEQQSLFL